MWTGRRCKSSVAWHQDRALKGNGETVLNLISMKFLFFMGEVGGGGVRACVRVRVRVCVCVCVFDLVVVLYILQ